MLEIVPGLIAAAISLLYAPIAGIWVDRSVERQGVAFGHRCSSCQAMQKPSSLIPVVHWFTRCSSCNQQKGFRYVATDVCVAAITFGLVAAVGLEIEIVIYLIAAFFLGALTVIDAETHLLPNVIVWPLVFFSLGAFAIVSLINWELTQFLSALIGAGVFSGFLFASFLAYPKGMGLGDVKLALILGLLIGWASEQPSEALLVTFYALIGALLAGALGGIIFNLIRRRGRAEIPFGPFLIAGTVVAILVT